MNIDVGAAATDPAPRARTPLLAAAVLVLTLGATAGCGQTPQRVAEPAHPQAQPLSVPCDIHSSRLAQTADAAEQWLRNCYDPAQLPRTADGLDHAFR